MDSAGDAKVVGAEVVLGCSDLGETISFFTERLGFRVETISPADDPSVATISGHGLRLRLERGRAEGGAVLRLTVREPDTVAGGARELVAPNGTRIELAEAAVRSALPPLRSSFVVSRLEGARWSEGRAGMRYRDLIPDRQGGRFIASHIQIAAGGVVPDYVHHHDVHFQAIYCHRGWVRVVYEDQGPPFVLEAGDCVLQPPRIRHRVLESSPGLEVIEIASPADHTTTADHALALPTAETRPDRDFDGQRFVRHRAAEATWRIGESGGIEHRDTGIAAATRGLASVRVARRTGSAYSRAATSHDGELLFFFILDGAATLSCEGHGQTALTAGDAIVIPPARPHAWIEPSRTLSFLEVALPSRRPSS